MSRPISITVLIPNFNHASLITKALRSVADQTRPADEVMVVDDCSTDDSIAVIESFRETIPGLRLIRNRENIGVNRTVNRTLGEVQGTYVTFLSADDWLEPTCLEKLAATVERFSYPRLCLTRFVQFDETSGRYIHHGQGSEIGHWYLSEAEGARLYSPEDLRKILHRGYTWLNLNGSLIHRDTLREVGGFDPNLRWHADWFVAFAIALRFGFAIIPEALSVFRQTGQNYSIGMRDPVQQRQVCDAIYDKLHSPEFADIGKAIYECPSALAPFLRHFLLGLARRPETWPFLVSPLLWWLNEVRKGRRPGVVRDFMRSLGVNTNPRM